MFNSSLLTETYCAWTWVCLRLGPGPNKFFWAQMIEPTATFSLSCTESSQLIRSVSWSSWHFARTHTKVSVISKASVYFLPAICLIRGASPSAHFTPPSVPRSCASRLDNMHYPIYKPDQLVGSGAPRTSAICVVQWHVAERRSARARWDWKTTNSHVTNLISWFVPMHPENALSVIWPCSVQFRKAKAHLNRDGFCMVLVTKATIHQASAGLCQFQTHGHRSVQLFSITCLHLCINKLNLHEYMFFSYIHYACKSGNC